MTYSLRKAFGLLMDRRIALFVEDHLGDTAAVANIDKMRLPRSRRRLTHPMSTAFLPESAGRSAPHM